MLFIVYYVVSRVHNGGVFSIHISLQNLGALSANRDNYNYIVPSVNTLCGSDSESGNCTLSYRQTIYVTLTFSLLRTLVRRLRTHCQ